MNKPSIYKTGYSGFSATFVGNGIGRFAYIALLPALVQANWFSQKDASYLGVATLVGYLVGSLVLSLLTRYLSERTILRVSMLLSGISYVACALPHAPLAWYYIWRLSAGVTGALLMIVGPSNVLRSCAINVRSKVSGIVFAGIGIGVLISGTIIPVFVDISISFTWVALGGISLLLAITTWNLWADDVIIDHTLDKNIKLTSKQYKFLALVLAAYSLNAIGYLPHTLFWVDYIVRELKMPLGYGGFFWAIFGIGAGIGPFFTSGLANRFSIKTALLIAFFLKSVGVFLPVISSSLPALFLSSLIVGALTPGTVTLIALYTLRGAGDIRYRASWNTMTLAFALSQALFSYVMAYVATTYLHSYDPLFIFSAIALLLSVVCIVFTNPKSLS